MKPIKPIKLHFYVANNFGPEYKDTFSELTRVLIDTADAMTANGVMLMSPYFQSTLIRKSLSFLQYHFPNHKFEHFFQNVDEENCYLVINNIHKHPALDTLAGQYLHDFNMMNLKTQ